MPTLTITNCPYVVLIFQDSSTLFRDAQAPGIDALWLSWGLGLVNFVSVAENGSVPACVLADSGPALDFPLTGSSIDVSIHFLRI